MSEQRKSNAVQLSPYIDDMLKELVEMRARKEYIRVTKKDVVAMLIINAHSKECKK